MKALTKILIGALLAPVLVVVVISVFFGPAALTLWLTESLLAAGIALFMSIGAFCGFMSWLDE